MAQRRLISPTIVESDAFLDMPISSQALYFHLCMNADDDGFVNPKKIMRLIGAAGDDLNVLLTKRFALRFENGVVVIKHWLIHNTIRKDRYHETIYTEEKAMLQIKENGAYTELATKWQPNGNLPAPEVKISKVKPSEVIKEATETVAGNEVNEIIDLFKGLNPSFDRLFRNKTERAAVERLLKKMGREKLAGTIAFAVQVNGTPYSPTITTPYELEKNLGKLIAFYKKELEKGTKNKIIDIT
jgi:hypothetical protein